MGELTSAERALLKKLKDRKKENKKLQAQLDTLKGVVMACGVSEATLDAILEGVGGD